MVETRIWIASARDCGVVWSVGFGVGRADGTRQGFWFGFTYDATIRIRPGRTDVRVAAREGRPDGEEACRLTKLIISKLQTTP